MMKNNRSLSYWFDVALSKFAYSRLYVDLNRELSNTLMLSSVHRSGSTFLMEALNYKKDYRIVFEPFHHGKIPLVEPYENPHYLPPDLDDATVKKTFQTILSGELRHPWSDGQNKTLFSKQRLIKCVRTNLMLKYIKTNFPDVVVLLLIRNPYAVINSWRRSGYDPQINRARILKQSALIEDHLSPFLPDYEKVSDTFELYMFNWCINHYVPFRQLEQGDAHIVFYESLIANTQTEIKRLFTHIGKAYSDDIFEQMKTPSRTTRKSDVKKMGTDYLKAWQQKFTDSEFERGKEILNLFGLEHLYNTDVPSYDALAAVMATE